MVQLPLIRPLEIREGQYYLVGFSQPERPENVSQILRINWYIMQGRGPRILQYTDSGNDERVSTDVVKNIAHIFPLPETDIDIQWSDPEHHGGSVE